MTRSTTATGFGLGASRRQRPGCSSFTGTPRAWRRATRVESSAWPIGLLGIRRLASLASHSVWVIRVTTCRAMPARASAFWSDCWIMYPIHPAVAATSTPSGNGSTWSAAISLRASSSPTCGPLPWTRAMRHPSRARSTIGARLARVWRNWFEIVGRSPAGRRRCRRARPQWYPRSRRRNLAALGGGSKLAAPQAEQVLQLGIQLAEPLQIAGGEGRVGLRRELLRPSPPRGERRVAGRSRVAGRGEEAPECGGYAPALAAVASPREKHGVDAGGRAPGRGLGEKCLLGVQDAGDVPESRHAGRRRTGGADQHRREASGQAGAPHPHARALSRHRCRYEDGERASSFEPLGHPNAGRLRRTFDGDRKSTRLNSSH